MKSTWLSSVGAVALALALAGPAAAQTDRFAEWDADKNGTISQGEYNAGVAKVGVFKRYDANADGKIDETEFGSAKLDAARYGDLSAFDANTDKSIDADEFGSRLFTVSRPAAVDAQGTDTTGTTAEGAGLTPEEFGTTQDIFDE